MKTINEIFATNPDLLETKEVKELIDQFHKQFIVIKDRNINYWSSILTLCMHSELFLKDGMSCKETLEKINKITIKN